MADRRDKTQGGLPEIAIWLVQNARPILLKYYSPDSCIESSAVAIDVLRAYGVNAYEAPVQVKVFNAPAWRLYTRGCYGSTPTERTAWEMTGAWSLGIGYIDTPMPSPGKYAGHLAVLIEGGWLLDLTLDQASRPQKNIVLDPLLQPAGLAEIAGQQPFFHPNGTVLVYSVNTTIWKNSYKTTPGWKNKGFRAKIVAEIKAAYEARKAVAV